MRDNESIIMLFEQDGLNLRHVYNDHMNIKYTAFKDMR